MRSPSVKQFRAFLKRELRMAEEALASQPDRDPTFWTYNGMVGALRACTIHFDQLTRSLSPKKGRKK